MNVYNFNGCIIGMERERRLCVIKNRLCLKKKTAAAMSNKRLTAADALPRTNCTHTKNGRCDFIKENIQSWTNQREVIVGEKVREGKKALATGIITDEYQIEATS